MSIRLISLSVILFCLSQSALAVVDIKYLARGDRYEGIKERPISGSDMIELVSAAVYSNISLTFIPKFYKLRFYLPKNYEVDDIVVRESRPRHYYWLDKVKQEWKSNHFNEYQWSTQEVIKPLEIEVSRLGVVVHLHSSRSRMDVVVPATFYVKDVPKSAIKYHFIFHLSTAAKLKYSLYDSQSESDTALFSEKLGKVPSGDQQPLVIELDRDLLKFDERFYELLVSGMTLNTHSYVAQKIIFYHKQ